MGYVEHIVIYIIHYNIKPVKREKHKLNILGYLTKITARLMCKIHKLHF